ncbi:ATP-binding protein [Parabacteroides sp. AF17-3]|uniref:AlbA family DNA-binding domain-containing protein n=1 Tax=Parabacteroides sp. AF17-3 TaxID=2293113 RepID=UPI000EFE797A|nr:RNA-binding domain-containing protein [Parabacteroides sp. AF17-3]RKU73811.1 ATP-binding protein [Parabacteroides sp. AF17-3]
MKDNYSSIVEFLENKGLLTESFDLEFKSAKGGFPKSFWETYSSFANTEGGIIILGISEKDDQCFYDGLPQMVMRKFQDDFWNQVNNREKVSFNLLLENDVQMLEIQEGQFILIFRISCADYRNRPVYIGSDPMKGTYKRCHTGDYKCTPDEVKRMLADSLPDKPDSRILENYTLEDLDEVSVAQYYKGGISVPRNNSIQTMFLLLGYGEKAGSGSTRIMNAWEGAHWRKPLINVLPRPDRVELCLSMEQLLPQKSINKLISVFGEEITHLYGDGLIALTTAEMEGCVSNVRLQQLINKHSTEISQLLKDLCNEGYLVAENKGRWTVYHLNLREEKKTVQKNLFEETMTPPVRNDDTSGETMTPRGKKWMRNEELMTLVVEICCDTFKSVDEIAAVILRTPTYLKNKILPLLLAQERLERLYPTIPNHPNQAYRKKQK